MSLGTEPFRIWMKIIDIITSRLLLIFLEILNLRKIYNPNYNIGIARSRDKASVANQCHGITGKVNSWELILLRTKARNESSWDISLQGAEVQGNERARERKGQGVKVPGNDSARVLVELLLQRANWPGSEKAVNLFFYVHLQNELRRCTAEGWTWWELSVIIELSTNSVQNSEKYNLQFRLHSKGQQWLVTKSHNLRPTKVQYLSCNDILLNVNVKNWFI